MMGRKKASRDICHRFQKDPAHGPPSLTLGAIIGGNLESLGTVSWKSESFIFCWIEIDKFDKVSERIRMKGHFEA